MDKKEQLIGYSALGGYAMGVFSCAMTRFHLRGTEYLHTF